MFKHSRDSEQSEALGSKLTPATSIAPLTSKSELAGQKVEETSREYKQRLAEASQQIAEIEANHATQLGQVESELSATRLGLATAEGNLKVVQDQLLHTQAAHEKALEELESEKATSSEARVAESFAQKLLIEREGKFAVLEKQLAEVSGELNAKVCLRILTGSGDSQQCEKGAVI